MNIYINNRIIKLKKKKPTVPGFHFISSKKQLSSICRQFEKGMSGQELNLYATDYKQLKKNFKAQYTLIHAAGGLVINDAGELLFIFRRGKWDLPKGKLDLIYEDPDRVTSRLNRNETPEQAAIREVKEETGIAKVTIIRKLKPTYHIYIQKRKRILKKTVWFYMQAPDGQQLIPQHDEDILDIKWFKPDELKIVYQNTFPSIAGFLRQVVGKEPFDFC